jgi:hypothetical protein
MSYTVLWLADAEQVLAALWLDVGIYYTGQKDPHVGRLS